MGVNRNVVHIFHTLVAVGPGGVDGTSFPIKTHDRGIILINITGIVNTPTMEAIIETSDDNAVWYFYGTVISEDDVDNLVEVTPNADKGKIKVAGQYTYHLANVLANYIRVRLVIAGAGATISGTVKGIFKD